MRRFQSILFVCNIKLRLLQANLIGPLYHSTSGSQLASFHPNQLPDPFDFPLILCCNNTASTMFLNKLPYRFADQVQILIADLWCPVSMNSRTSEISMRGKWQGCQHRGWNFSLFIAKWENRTDELFSAKYPKMLSFSLVAEALTGLIYHRPSGEKFLFASKVSVSQPSYFFTV